MKATVLDLRRRMKDVISALNRNEKVTIFYRGREKGVIHPTGAKRGGEKSITGHPAFGLWKDHGEMREVEKAVRRLRKDRFHVV